MVPTIFHDFITDLGDYASPEAANSLHLTDSELDKITTTGHLILGLQFSCTTLSSGSA